MAPAGGSWRPWTRTHTPTVSAGAVPHPGLTCSALHRERPGTRADRERRCWKAQKRLSPAATPPQQAVCLHFMVGRAGGQSATSNHPCGSGFPPEMGGRRCCKLFLFRVPCLQICGSLSPSGGPSGRYWCLLRPGPRLGPQVLGVSQLSCTPALADRLLITTCWLYLDSDLREITAASHLYVSDSIYHQ